MSEETKKAGKGKRLRRKPHVREWLAAGMVSLVVVVLAAIGRTWPFRSTPLGIDQASNPSVWQYLMSDRTTLGFVRLALVFAGLFVVASVVALAVAGRWMRGFGGLSVDEKETAEERITELEAQLEETQADLVEEQRQRFEAEDWADTLIDELDETTIELEETRRETEGGGEADGEGTSERDPGEAG